MVTDIDRLICSIFTGIIDNRRGYRIAHCRTLFNVAQMPGSTCANLARSINTAPQAMSNSLFRAAAGGLIYRDERKRYYLTVEGTELYNKLRTAVSAELSGYEAEVLRKLIR